MLSGRSYMSEITTSEAGQAKAAGLVVVFGYSDDCMEFRGAICDEVDCYNGRTVYVTKDGVLNPPDCDCDDCSYFSAAKKSATPIKAVWNENGPGPCWTYETEIPHETFEIFDERELWCVGIVFDVELLCKKVIGAVYCEGRKIGDLAIPQK